MFFLFLFLKGKNKDAGVNHHLLTFLNPGFGSQNASGLHSLARWSMAGDL